MFGSFTEKRYQALLDDIFRRFPSVQKDGFTAGAYKPGLSRMLEFDAALGFQSKRLKAIHIAGTNGKGSTAVIMAAALSSCGLKTGLFTSPHLLDFRERARIVGSGVIPKEYVFGFLEEWLPWIQEHDLSFFEITTGLAFKWFADSEVDAAVIEVGLGGRLDSTNILTPVLSVITTIGLDHCALLGGTLPEIAAEKAGIIKPGVPVVIGETQQITAPVFVEKSGGRAVFADQCTPSLWDDGILARMDLRADVQGKNLRTVLTAVDILRELPGFEALNNGKAVIDGIVSAAALTQFHGRWERLSLKPEVICDIGHNPQALENSFAQLKRLIGSGRYSSLTIVYGIMADKDLDAIIPLMPSGAKYIFVAPSTPRALPSEEILRRFCGIRREEAVTAPSVSEGVRMALSDSDGLVYIGGSAFVVAEALPEFNLSYLI